jgi:hypothetical protein
VGLAVGVGLALPSFRLREITEGYGKPYPYTPYDKVSELAKPDRRSYHRDRVRGGGAFAGVKIPDP